MIIAFKHEDIEVHHVGKFYHDLYGFMQSEFNVEISDNGAIRINGELNSISYSLGTGNRNWTKEDAVKDYSESKQFKEFAKSRNWTLYLIEKKIL